MYDNITFIGDIFHTEELINFTPEFLNSMAPLVDDFLGVEIKKSVEAFDASEISKNSDVIADRLTLAFNMIKTILGPPVKRATLHFEAEARGIFKYLEGFKFSSPYQPSEQAVVKDNIDWLLSNEKYWTSTLKPRKKEDFDAFYSRCEMLSHSCDLMDKQLEGVGGKGVLIRTPKLLTVIYENSVLFYNKTEHEKVTRMSNVIYMRDYLVEVQRGIDWDRYCSEHEISYNMRRRLVL